VFFSGHRIVSGSKNSAVPLLQQKNVTELNKHTNRINAEFPWGSCRGDRKDDHGA
jgi:hypothetical protein